MQYDDANGEGYQPEVPLYNSEAFAQNQHINPSPQVGFFYRPHFISNLKLWEELRIQANRYFSSSPHLVTLHHHQWRLLPVPLLR